MLTTVWTEIPIAFPTVVLDAFVIMANHIHGVMLLDAEHIVNNPRLGEVVQWYKTITTIRYTHGVRDFNWNAFDGRLWPRSYYEHIVRDDRDLERIRSYIANNPANWPRDVDNMGSTPGSTTHPSQASINRQLRST